MNSLEKYELYRMCLMLADRYELGSEIRGRFIAAISSKYSNLLQFKFTWHFKFRQANWLDAQRKYTAVANEAMHNVLAMVGCVEEDESEHWRAACFDPLFNMGFWKRLLFLIGTDAGL